MRSGQFGKVKKQRRKGLGFISALVYTRIVLISQPYGCALRTMDSPTG